MCLRFILSLSLLLWFSASAQAQEDLPTDPQEETRAGRWQALTAFNEVVALAATETTVWAATSGGVFGYTPETGELVRYTTIEGLATISTTALAYDPASDVLWIGHTDGALDRLDIATGRITSFFDIRRTEQFAARQIERLRIGTGVLYVATGFGIVVFDTERLEVRNSYTRLGPLEAGVAVRDVLEAPVPDGRPGFWAATARGIVWAPTEANLLEPGAWTFDANGPDEAGLLVAFDGSVVAGTPGDALRRQGEGTWTRLFVTGSGVRAFVVDGTRLIAVDPFFVNTFEPGQQNRRYAVRGDFEGFADIITAATLGPGEQLWVGDLREGLMRMPLLPSESGDVVPEQIVVPEGPRSNQIADLDVGLGSAVWLAPRRTVNRTTAARRDADGTWRIYTEADGLPASGLRDALVARDGSFWGGTDGRGLIHIDGDDLVTVFGPQNSTLLPTNPSSDFVPVVDVAQDGRGQIWAVNQATQIPLHVYTQEEEWEGFAFPSNVASNDAAEGLLIDRFDQKWVFNRETGIFVYPAGEEPLSGAAPYIRASGSTSGIGLPNPFVRVLTQDQDGRIWVGTERGLATIFSPGSAFGGDPSLIAPQWARTEDGTAFFLRDLFITDIAVDPANNKWIASSSGAWLIDPEGEQVLTRFTSDNSPLFSDNVLAVDVDATTGVVYFATDRGVLSYRAEAIAAARSVGDLGVAPNPYRPVLHGDGVLITGLVAETRVRILTADGRLVRSLDARGGAIRWDGRDQDGQSVPSGVYLVAATGTSDEGTGFGKIAVIR